MVTSGRYYFAEPSTPHVEGLHHLGSRSWHDSNWIVGEALGEQAGAKEWSDGLPPERSPKAIQIGLSRCLAEGESIDDGLSVDDLVNGFPAGCFPALDPLDPRWFIVSDYAFCPTQSRLAKIINLIYLGVEVDIIAEVVAWLGADLTIIYTPENGNLPGVVCVVHPTWSMAIANGTTTYQQIAIQGLTALRSPTNIGLFGTVPLWYEASTRMLDLLEAAGSVPGTPVMLSGHSYGGAASLILAARLYAGNADRLIRYLTFGTPKTGDRRLQMLIAKCEGINLCNDGDLITVFPPDPVTLFPVMLALGFPGFSVYANWLPPPNQVRMNLTGKLFANDQSKVDYETLFLWLSNVLGGLDEPFVFEHSITEYRRRIGLRCGVPPISLIPGTDCDSAAIFDLDTFYEVVLDSTLGAREFWFQLRPESQTIGNPDLRLIVTFADLEEDESNEMQLRHERCTPPVFGLPFNSSGTYVPLVGPSASFGRFVNLVCSRAMHGPVSIQFLMEHFN